MSIYSKQLIVELNEHLDSRIKDFFEDTKDELKYPVRTINDLVEYSLDTYLDGKTTREDLRKVYDGLIRNRRRRKSRWLEKLEEDIKIYEQDDPRYPFARLVMQKRVLTKSQWRTYYGDKTLDDVIEEQMRAAKKWLSDKDAYFVTFPGLLSHTPNRIFEALVVDATFCMISYINEHYEGAIENYFLSFPRDLIGFPLFAPKKVTLNTVQDADGVMVEKYNYGEGILETSTNLQTVNEQLNSMDQNDLKILYTTLQNLDEDFYTTRQARVKKRVLVKLLHDRPSKKHYDMAELHCHKLAEYTFAVIKNGRKQLSFNLIDSVDTSDPDEVVFTYGNLLYNSIIKNDITNIKSSNIQILEMNLSTLLYQPLFAERIILSTKNSEETTELIEDYPYTFFTNNVRFPNQSKKKNMDMIEASLSEFVEKKIVVKSFERRASNSFRIHFFPLSEEEREDLTYNRFKAHLQAEN